MPFRIALFVPTLSGGGAERVITNLAIAFSGRGIAVDLVLIKAEGTYLKEIPPAVRIVNLNASRALAAIPALVRYLRAENPHAVLSAMNHANIVLLLAKLISWKPVRIFVSEHNAMSVSLKHEPRIKASVQKLLMKTLYRYANGIVAVSKGVADDLAGLLHIDVDRITVIHNPIVNDSVVSLSTRAVPHPWFLSKSVPVILAAGRITAQKDFQTLLLAFILARKKRPLRLVILGEGELRPNLEAMVKRLELDHDVALPGFVDNPFAFMRNSDAFVLSSRWEGFGNVLVEAMACGVPVISTDCPSGPAEILENGKWGRLVPVGDADTLARAILDTLDNPGPSPVQRAMEFSVAKSADAYLELLLANAN